MLFIFDSLLTPEELSGISQRLSGNPSVCPFASGTPNPRKATTDPVKGVDFWLHLASSCLGEGYGTLQGRLSKESSIQRQLFVTIGNLRGGRGTDFRALQSWRNKLQLQQRAGGREEGKKRVPDALYWVSELYNKNARGSALVHVAVSFANYWNNATPLTADGWWML